MAFVHYFHAHPRMKILHPALTINIFYVIATGKEINYHAANKH